MDDEPVAVKHHVQHSHPAGVRFCALCGGAMRLRVVAPDRKRHKVCTSCGYVDFLGPKLVAGCLVIRDARVLLLRRGTEPQLGKWTFPGGYVDLGETPQQAALRETREEVGMAVRITKLVGLYCDPNLANAAVAAYVAEPGARPPTVSDEASEVRYFSPDEIPWDELAFQTTADALRDWARAGAGSR